MFRIHFLLFQLTLQCKQSFTDSSKNSNRRLKWHMHRHTQTYTFRRKENAFSYRSKTIFNSSNEKYKVPQCFGFNTTYVYCMHCTYTHCMKCNDKSKRTNKIKKKNMPALHKIAYKKCSFNRMPWKNTENIYSLNENENNSLVQICMFYSFSLILQYEQSVLSSIWMAGMLLFFNACVYAFLALSLCFNIIITIVVVVVVVYSSHSINWLNRYRWYILFFQLAFLASVF